MLLPRRQLSATGRAICRDSGDGRGRSTQLEQLRCCYISLPQVCHQFLVEPLFTMCKDRSLRLEETKIRGADCCEEN
jgi:hypothetical protein